MLGVFAQFERETIIDRVITGMERKAARGQWCGGYRPYGYELNSTTGKLVPVPGEAQLIPVIFRLYVDDRMGTRALAAELNRRGLRTKNGKRWSGQSVMVVLRNRAYLGEVYYRGVWHRADHHHEPILESDLFDQAQRIIETRGDDHSRRASNGSDYLLAGRVTCTHCGKRFIGTAAKGNKYRYRYYTCFSVNRYGKGHCDAERLPADQLEQEILDTLLEVFADTGLIARAVKATTDCRDDQDQHLRDEIETIAKELGATEEAIDRYLTAFETGVLPQSLCAPRPRARREGHPAQRATYRATRAARPRRSHGPR